MQPILTPDKFMEPLDFTNIFTNLVLPNIPPLFGYDTTNNELNQCLTRLLMIDMIYGKTGNDTQGTTSEILSLLPKTDSPQTYQTLSVRSPSSSQFSTLTSSPEYKPLYKACGLCKGIINEPICNTIDGQSYHVHCLKCSACQIPLGFEETCFMKEGSLYCRTDYYKKYSNRCSKCDIVIQRTESVMKIRDAFFHLPCFNCHICATELKQGDRFFMSSNKHLFCYAHHDVICNTVLCDDASSQPEETNREGSEEPEDFADDDSNGSNCRSKRMRTSFKHHQLKTMKQYFNVNHNPDAKDLKQLAQKTGLTKRVLQVWFQNARAKYRRSMQCHDGDGMSPIIHTPIQNLPLEPRQESTKPSADCSAPFSTNIPTFFESTRTLISL